MEACPRSSCTYLGWTFRERGLTRAPARAGSPRSGKRRGRPPVRRRFAPPKRDGSSAASVKAFSKASSGFAAKAPGGSGPSRTLQPCSTPGPRGSGRSVRTNFVRKFVPPLAIADQGAHLPRAGLRSILNCSNDFVELGYVEATEMSLFSDRFSNPIAI